VLVFVFDLDLDLDLVLVSDLDLDPQNWQNKTPAGDTNMSRPKVGNDPEWAVLPHDPMEQLADNLWRVEGDLPGMALRRAMTVARLAGGGLVLHSAIALDEAGMAGLEQLGTPQVLVVPNGWHRLDAARYKARYPDLKVVCPIGARKAVSKVVEVDADYSELPLAEPGDETVRLTHFGDNRGMEGAMVVRSSDGVTAAFADSLFNLPHGKGFFWWFYGRVMGGTGGPKVTPLSRLMMTVSRSKKPFKGWLEELAEGDDLVRLIPGHGAVVSDDARGVTRTIADSL